MTISILMPLHNGVEFLNESVSSIVNQSFKKWELLIGLNGNKEQEEEVKEIINKFNDIRIKLFIYDFKSKTKTLNSLTTESNFNYICLIDVDDYWLPQKLDKQLLWIGHYDVIGTNAEYFGNKTGYPEIFLGKLNIRMFIWQNAMINSSVMITKRDAWWHEDWEGLDDYNLWMHLLCNHRVLFNIPEVLIKHRIHDTSYFNKKNEEMHKAILEKSQKLTEEDYIELGDIMDNKKWVR